MSKKSYQRLQVILTGTFCFHILVLMSVECKMPRWIKNHSSSHAPVVKTTMLDIALIRSSDPRSDTPSKAATHPLPHLNADTHKKQIDNYIIRWQSYVESFGNRYYPLDNLSENTVGRLRLLVAIQANGTIENIALLQSSGSQALDQAAIDIVQKAAPFEPLPPEISRSTKVLTITRTWQFNGRNRIIAT